jgi:broad specificity phosphatase PhoE
MSRARRIYLFRHGRTDWNAEGRIQGHLDVPLNDEGRAQARRLLAPLARLGVEAYLSSDLSRARETAEIARGRRTVPLHTHPGLREIHLGELQGLTHAEISARYGEEFSRELWKRALNDEDVAKLGSESGEQVLARALGAVREFLRAHGHARVAVATHGGVIRRVLQHASADRAFPPAIVNCTIFPLLWHAGEDRFELETWNPIR